MPQGSSPSPRFKRPPVVETILGVHFRPPDGFDLVRRVQSWSQLFESRFPNVEERMPLDEVREEFGEDLLPAGPQVQVRWQASAPSARLWAKSTDGKHTVQIQNDAFLANWERDPERTEPYLDYRERKREFESNLCQLNQFLTENRLGRIEPTSCFVRYINHVVVEGTVSFSQMMEKLLAMWCNETSDDWLPPVEVAALKFSFTLPAKGGRLHVTAVPGLRHRDKRRILRLDLTARGTPDEQTIPSALEWLDLGHDWVVRGFASLTRRAMHQEWERIQ
jgi:uncharacterized protein (TIGR04255 family)